MLPTGPQIPKVMDLFTKQAENFTVPLWTRDSKVMDILILTPLIFELARFYDS